MNSTRTSVYRAVPYFIYLLSTAAAAAFAGRNMDVAAGAVLMVCAAVLAVIFLLRDRCFVSFPFLLSAFWIGGEGLGAMQLSRLQSDWTAVSWISFTGFYLFFLAGYDVLCLVYRRKNSGVHPEKRPEKAADAKAMQKRLFRCIAAVSCISFLAFAAEVLILGYIPVFSKETHAYDHFHVTGIHYFTVSCMFTHVLTVIYILINKAEKPGRKKIIMLAVFNLMSLSIPVFCISKFMLVLAVALPILVWLLMAESMDLKKTAAVLGGALVIIAAAAVFMTFRRNYEPGYLDSIFQMKDRNLPMGLQYVYMYIANNYANFNCLTQAAAEGTVAYTFGLKQLFPVFALTGLKFIVPQLVAFEMPVTITELNTLTIIYDAFYDFGVAGVLLFGIILGAVCALLTMKKEKAGRNVNPIIYLFYAQMALYIILSFFSAWFTVPTTWFWFAITAMMYLYVNGFTKKC